jgi:outer membrane protein assembly factor BamE (lipoprotein component of BamABCDE complex)
MPAAKTLIGLLVLLVLTQGCAFVRGTYGEEVNQGDVTTITKGVSTRADVAAILGAPDKIVEANDHEIHHYYRFDVKSGFVLFFSRTNIKSEDVFVIYDKAGTVEEVLVGRKKPPLEFQFWPFDWP